MAGMSIAAELAGSRTVAVLEREDDLGYHATSRSAAALLESYGSVEIRALTRASRRLLAAADTTTPLLTPRPLLWIADAAHADAVADLLGEQPDLRAISTADAAAMCPVLRADTLAAAAVETGAHDIDVAALLQMYVAARVGGRRGRPPIVPPRSRRAGRRSVGAPSRLGHAARRHRRERGRGVGRRGRGASSARGRATCDRCDARSPSRGPSSRSAPRGRWSPRSTKGSTSARRVPTS